MERWGEKMKKRVLAFLLSLCFVVALVPVTVSAENGGDAEIWNTWGGIDWNFTVTDEDSGTGTLTIRPTTGTPAPDACGRTYEVGQWREAVKYNSNGDATAIGGWPYDRSKITKLVIEEGVTSIGSFAAQNFTNLTGEVIIPSTVTYIGQEAFQNDPITKLTFAKGGTEALCLGPGAFKTLNIQELTLPDDRPVEIHCWAFNGCAQLTDITLPVTVVGLPGWTHAEYYGMDWVYGQYASASEIFAHCAAVERLTFGDETIKNLYLSKGRQDTLKAMVGLTAYSNLQEALNVAAENEQDKTVTLVADVTVATGSTLEIPEGVTLKLNGKTLTNNGTLINLGYIDGTGTVKNNTEAGLAENSVADTVTWIDGDNGVVYCVCAVIYKVDGKAIRTIAVKLGEDAVAPEIPAKVGYDQIAPVWDKDGKNITARTEINAVYTINEYTVTYKIDGEIVKTETVAYGADAPVPEIPAKVGYDQTAPVWDKDGKNITADTEINAVYTVNQYTVTYKIDGEAVKTETVEHGTDAVAPEIPAKVGYDQIAPAWDKDGKNITADTEISAVYTADKYTVTYKVDGEIVKTETVEYGKDAVAPKIPAKVGYDETAPVWDKDGKNITADTEISAVYTINQYTVTYKIDGEVVKTETVEHGTDAVASEIPTKVGYDQTAPVWDKDGKNITTDTEISAVYTANKYTVTYKVDGEIVKTDTVEYGKDAVAPKIPAKVGYDQIAPVWDKDGKNITANTEISAVYTINQYTVTYKIDGKVVKTETVEYGKDAVAPEIPAKVGYDQIAPVWDKNSKNITADTVITAVYTKNEPGKYTDITTPANNADEGKLVNSMDRLRSAVPLTDDEETSQKNGSDVQVWLEMKDISETVSVGEKALVEEKLDGGVADLYLDVTMFKKVGNGEAAKMPQLNEAVTISLAVPDELINTDKNVIRTYFVVRIHDGVAQTITPAFDSATKTLTFETDCFSTYAITYKDTQVSSPATGDGNPVFVWTAILVVSGCAVAALSRKRRVDGKN